MDFQKIIRKWAGVLITAVMYFIVHEGAHALYALSIGAFKSIRILGIGMQVETIRENMTNLQFGIVNLAGALATIIMAYPRVAYWQDHGRQKQMD